MTTWPDRMRWLFGLAALAMLTACGGDQVIATGDEPDGDGEFQSIPYRLLAEDLALGSPWSTARLSEDEVWAAVPTAELDEESVVFRFTLAESSSCPIGRMTDLEFFAGDARLYPVVETVDSNGDCTSDANPHTIIVAVVRADLPAGGFTLWVERNDPPSGVSDGQTLFAPGELREPPHDLSEFPALGASGDIEVGETRIIYSASTHCGLDRLWRTVAGRQWEFEGGWRGGDYVPVEWQSFQRGENVDLQVTRSEADLLVVSALGSTHTETYVPLPVSEESGCA